ncbi:MAG TPA: 3-methyl-2-oxobutanoate hydroxymethyltransferase, partial [Salinisphaeraceae bacterium]|nr:3-methyl-2-oxobutanoate hydroxymethyltransferase [Salinisphaeraceae bacterium]
LAELARMKAAGEKVACLTAYDASFAALEERAGIEVVLVGDSLGMVIQGEGSTIPVTLADMVYHSRIVAAGLQRPLLIADLPFLSFASPRDALASARRLMQEGGAQMVKLEGGEAYLDTVRHLSDNGVPVCAHIGLQPQQVHKLGGYKVQGRTDTQARQLQREARLLEEAGADMLLLECVPKSLAATITVAAKVPVIGIGAGPDTDGQILVIYDILGIATGVKPRFVKNFMAEADHVEAAVAAYVAAVKSGAYPRAEHSFS